MTTALSVFLAQVNILVPAGVSTLAAASRNALIKQAVEQYSRDAPDRRIDDTEGDGGKYYEIGTVCPDWVEGASQISAIQYPAPTIASDEPPLYLSAENWVDDYWASDVRYLYLPNHSPAAGQYMRITYTVPWLWSADADPTTTVPESDFYAVCQLAACSCCRVIATKYSEMGDSTITADAAGHVTKAQEFAQRAQDYCEAYSKALGLLQADGAAAKSTEPVGVFVDLNTSPNWGSRSWLFGRNR